MKNPQKTVLTMLIAILLLEFGSMDKLKKLWELAFVTEEVGFPIGSINEVKRP